MAAEDTLKLAINQSKRATPDLSQFRFGTAQTTPSSIVSPSTLSEQDVKGAGAKEVFRLANSFGIPGNVASATSPLSQIRAAAAQQPKATDVVNVVQPTKTKSEPTFNVNLSNLTDEQVARLQKNAPQFLEGTPEGLRQSASLPPEQRAEMGLSPEPTGDELAAQVFDDDEFNLAKERIDFNLMTTLAEAEAKKAQLEAEFEGDKQALGEQLAQQGFSLAGGIGSTKVRAMMENLAASELGLDREIAAAVMDANFDIREEIMNQVARQVKAAADGRKEEIDQLNKAGFAVVNGQLVPTLQAQQEERLARQAELDKTQVVTVGGEVRLINKQTGETIRSLGSSSSGSTTKPLTTKSWIKDFNQNPIVGELVGQASTEEILELFTQEEPPQAFVDSLLENEDTIGNFFTSIGMPTTGKAVSGINIEQVKQSWKSTRTSVLEDFVGTGVEQQFTKTQIQQVQTYTGKSFEEVKRMNVEEFNQALNESKSADIESFFED